MPDISLLMRDLDFWSRLERLISQSIRENSDKSTAGHWCDGFLPSSYKELDGVVEIEGTCFLGPTGQDRNAFRAFFSLEFCNNPSELLKALAANGIVAYKPNQKSLIIRTGPIIN